MFTNSLFIKLACISVYYIEINISKGPHWSSVQADWLTTNNTNTCICSLVPSSQQCMIDFSTLLNFSLNTFLQVGLFNEGHKYLPTIFVFFSTLNPISMIHLKVASLKHTLSWLGEMHLLYTFGLLCLEMYNKYGSLYWHRQNGKHYLYTFIVMQGFQKYSVANGNLPYITN